MAKKIAYTRLTPWPAANTIVGETLQAAFPEYQVDVLDLSKVIKRSRSVVAANFVQVLRLYGRDVLARKRPLRDCFFRTPYMFRQMRKMILDHFASGQYEFTFQIQSMFDASLPGVPHFVYTDHTHLANLYYPIFDKQKLYSRAWIDLEKTVYEHAYINFTWSAHISRSMIEQYHCDPQRVVCVYAGSNVDVTDKPLTNNNYHNKNILFVGMDWERKGGPELVEAFKRVRAKHPDAKLTIVGCSPTIDVPGVQVVGRVPIGDVPRYYQNASIFCLPSKLEPFGIAFIEALAHKLPVVAANIGAVPDFVVNGENGFLVEPGAVEELALALVTVLDSPDMCRQFGVQGYQIAQRYTWSSVGERLKQHIESVIQPATVFV